MPRPSLSHVWTWSAHYWYYYHHGHHYRYYYCHHHLLRHHHFLRTFYRHLAMRNLGDRLHHHIMCIWDPWSPTFFLGPQRWMQFRGDSRGWHVSSWTWTLKISRMSMFGLCQPAPDEVNITAAASTRCNTPCLVGPPVTQLEHADDVWHMEPAAEMSFTM